MHFEIGKINRIKTVEQLLKNVNYLTFRYKCLIINSNGNLLELEDITKALFR